MNATETEITRSISLEPGQSVALNAHSFLNILNVLNLQLHELADLCGLEQAFAGNHQFLRALGQEIARPELIEQRLAGLTTEIAAMRQALDLTLATRSGACQPSPAVRDALENLDSIFAILDLRLADLKARSERMRWQWLEVAQVTDDMNRVLNAIEKNAKGRYRLVDNIAAQEPEDYYVDFKVTSSEAPRIRMPPVLVDVVRDLIANARKYTQPGGRISAGIWSDGAKLRVSVEDSGLGIPADELESVIEYGWRGSNVRALPTMGSGLGLTKAYVICKRFGGRFWIRSALDQGTRIRLEIPVAAEQASAPQDRIGWPTRLRANAQASLPIGTERETGEIKTAAAA